MVSEHAVKRWIERVAPGLSREAARAEIEAIVRGERPLDDGARLVCVDGNVVTVKVNKSAPPIRAQIAALGTCQCGAHIVLMREARPQPMARFYCKSREARTRCARGDACPMALVRAFEALVLERKHRLEADRIVESMRATCERAGSTDPDVVFKKAGVWIDPCLV